MRDEPLDGDQEWGDARVASGRGLAQNRDGGDEEDEKNEEDGAGEDDGEDQFARGEDAAAPRCTGCGGREGRRGGRDHWAVMGGGTGLASTINGGTPVSNAGAMGARASGDFSNLELRGGREGARGGK